MKNPCDGHRLIGEILIERGFITQAQLEKALAAQKDQGGCVYLGGVLIGLGYVTEIDIVTAVVLQCNLPYIAVSKHLIDPQIARLIPADVACGNRLVPLDRIGNILSIVALNPLDAKVRRELEGLTGCHIAMFISTASQIDQALARAYPAVV